MAKFPREMGVVAELRRDLRLVMENEERTGGSANAKLKALFGPELVDWSLNSEAPSLACPPFMTGSYLTTF
jgi:hypothetical protein